MRIKPFVSDYELGGINRKPLHSALSSTKFHSGGGGSSEGTTTPQATPQQMMAMYNQYLPQMLGTVTSQIAPTTAAMAGAASSANPLYTATGLSQLRDFAPGYQRAGADIASSQAGATADLLRGEGGRASGEAMLLSNRYNPAQAEANRQSVNLLNSIDINGLSGSERAEVERSLNQSNQGTGNLGVDNATNVVNNAMRFGSALSAKRADLGNAIGIANNTAQSQNSIFNPVTTAIGAGNTAGNFGLSTFNPTQANATLNTPFAFGSSFGNQLAGVSSASKGTTTSSNASGGCFLTTVVCEWKGLPDDCEELTILRKFRDTIVPKCVVEEYYRIAPGIVESIKNNTKDLEYVWEMVQKSISYIKEGQNSKALETYMDMVNYLKG